MVSPPRAKACAALVLAAFAGGLVAAPKPKLSVAVPPPVEPPPTTRPSWPPIPKETLVAMYRAELGDRFRPEQVDRLHQVHELIERYFEAGTMADRRRVATQLHDAEIDPVIVGRLCRVRMYWPALDAGGVYYVNEKVGVHPTRYFFGLPAAYDRTKPWPLVIKLPTAHAFLSEPPPTAEQVAEVYARWVKEEQAAHPDAVVVMPLLNLGELWGPSYAGTSSVMQPLQHVAGRANVDPARVYLLGHGMSGHAAWNLALHYTTYFAAFNPLAGGASASWQRMRVVNLRNVLPVVWHDADDDVMKVDSSRGVVKALRLQKVDVEYEETKGIGHTPDAATAERAYQKMRARTRDLYPPSVAVQSNRPDTMFNRVDWLGVFQPIETGKERRALLRHGSGTFVYHDQAFKAEATRTGQKVEVTTSNVDSFRLYFNDQMIDLREPVVITVNGRPRAQGVVRQSVHELLADQLFLGRGWRYYTAVVDVEMSARVPATRPSTRPATRQGTAPATRRAQ